MTDQSSKPVAAKTRPKQRHSTSVTTANTTKSDAPIDIFLGLSSGQSRLARERARIDDLDLADTLEDLGRALVDTFTSENRSVVDAFSARIKAEEERFVDERRRELQARAAATDNGDPSASPEAGDVPPPAGEGEQMELPPTG